MHYTVTTLAAAAGPETTAQNLAAWSMFVGAISATFVLPILQQPRWSARVRAEVMFAYALIASLGVAWFGGAVTGVDWHSARAVGEVILYVLVSTVATYKGLAKPLGVAPAIERATSGAPPPRSPVR